MSIGFFILCAKCKKEFPERELQLSHDVPRYIGGTDKDGRHYLCKKCHDIYERLVASFMLEGLNEDERKIMRERARKFASGYFKEGNKNDGQ